jgi:hypothetical protein
MNLWDMICVSVAIYAGIELVGKGRRDFSHCRRSDALNLEVPTFPDWACEGDSTVVASTQGDRTGN